MYVTTIFKKTLIKKNSVYHLLSTYSVPGTTIKAEHIISLFFFPTTLEGDSMIPVLHMKKLGLQNLTKVPQVKNGIKIQTEAGEALKPILSNPWQ